MINARCTISTYESGGTMLKRSPLPNACALTAPPSPAGCPASGSPCCVSGYMPERCWTTRSGSTSTEKEGAEMNSSFLLLFHTMRISAPLPMLVYSQRLTRFDRSCTNSRRIQICKAESLEARRKIAGILCVFQDFSPKSAAIWIAKMCAEAIGTAS